MKRQYRVRKKTEFKKILDEGQKISSNICKIFYLKNNSTSRIGISVPSAIGNAVVRNKIRRQVRDILSKNYDFTQSVDIVIIIKSEFLKQSFLDNQKNLITCLNKMNLNNNQERKLI